MLKKLNRLFYFFSYCLVVTMIIFGGLRYAFIKNKHTLVQREIIKLEKSTRAQQNLLTQHKADLQNSSNRFLLKKRIKSSHTALVPIKTEDVITIPSVQRPSLVKSEQ